MIRQQIKDLLDRNRIPVTELLVLELENLVYQFSLNVVSGRKMHELEPRGEPFERGPSMPPHPEVIPVQFSAGFGEEESVDEVEVSDVTEYDAEQDALKNKWESDHE